LLAICQCQSKMKRYKEAAAAAKTAQALFHEEEDDAGEADAFFLMGEAHLIDGDEDKCIRAAEQARRLYKNTKSKAGEVNSLTMLGQASVNMESKALADGKAKKGKDGFDKALKAGKDALAIAKKMSEAEDGRLFEASALNVLSQVHTLNTSNQKADEGASEGNEAVSLAREGGDELMEAIALVNCAMAEVVLSQWKEAREDANEAMKLFKKDPDDDIGPRGVEWASGVLDQIEQLEPKMMPNMAQMQAMMAQQQYQVMQPMAPQGGDMGGGGGGGASKAIAPRAGSPLQMSSGMDPSVIRNKVMETAVQIIGDAEDIEADTPLMQAGLTSNTAVLLRDELGRDLPGINLPPTLIFDYPSIQAMADFILEKSKMLK